MTRSGGIIFKIHNFTKNRAGLPIGDSTTGVAKPSSARRACKCFLFVVRLPSRTLQTSTFRTQRNKKFGTGCGTGNIEQAGCRADSRCSSTVGPFCRKGLRDLSRLWVHVGCQSRYRVWRDRVSRGSPCGESPARQAGPTVGPFCRKGLRGLPRPCVHVVCQSRGRDSRDRVAQGSPYGESPARQAGPTKRPYCRSFLPERTSRLAATSGARGLPKSVPSLAVPRRAWFALRRKSCSASRTYKMSLL